MSTLLAKYQKVNLQGMAGSRSEVYTSMCNSKRERESKESIVKLCDGSGDVRARLSHRPVGSARWFAVRDNVASRRDQMVSMRK